MCTGEDERSCPERAQVPALQDPRGRAFPRGANHRATQFLGADHRPRRDCAHQQEERPKEGIGDPRPARLRDFAVHRAQRAQTDHVRGREHFQQRAPMDVRFDKNTIRLVFKKEVQVLRSVSF